MGWDKIRVEQWLHHRLVCPFCDPRFRVSCITSLAERQGNNTPKIFFQRSIFVGSIATVGIGSALVIYAFYLPIWFQVIRGKSPESSGLSLLPLLLSNVLAVVGGGIATSLFGYYTPFMLVGSAILVVGSALITTWSANIGRVTWIGFQVSCSSVCA